MGVAATKKCVSTVYVCVLGGGGGGELHVPRYQCHYTFVWVGLQNGGRAPTLCMLPPPGCIVPHHDDFCFPVCRSVYQCLRRLPNYAAATKLAVDIMLGDVEAFDTARGAAGVNELKIGSRRALQYDVRLPFAVSFHQLRSTCSWMSCLRSVQGWSN